MPLPQDSHPHRPAATNSDIVQSELFLLCVADSRILLCKDESLFGSMFLQQCFERCIFPFTTRQ